MKILITGASEGLGYTLSQKMTESGHDVVGISLSPIEIKNVTWIKCDLSSHNEVQNIDIGKPEEFDILFNNCGVMSNVSITDSNVKKIAETMSVNLISPIFLATKISLAWLINEKSFGKIINIGSIAEDIGHPDISYCTSKLGLRGLTLSLNNLLRSRDNLKSYHVVLGPMQTNFIKKISEEHRNYIKKHIHISGEYLSPDEVANFLLQLSEENNIPSEEIFYLNKSITSWKSSLKK